MSGKNHYPNTYNWQSTNPITGFLPNPRPNGSIPSGTVNGAMASTNVIYSNIIDLSFYDNIGLEVTWTGTPTGTIEVLVSNSGINFYSLTFNPGLTQPAGSASGYVIDLNQIPFRYLLLRYTNASGSGTLTAYGFGKDLN